MVDRKKYEQERKRRRLDEDDDSYTPAIVYPSFTTYDTPSYDPTPDFGGGGGDFGGGGAGGDW